MRKNINASIMILAVIGSLILINLVGLRLFRVDLTRAGTYTLNQASIKMLQSLKDPVTVRAYITKEMPPPWSSTASYVQDMLEEYYARAGGNFRYQVLDPAEMETEADKQKKKDLKRDVFGRIIRQKTSVEQELEQLGILPFPAGRMDADSKEVKMVYLGLAISYGNQKEVIPKVETDPSGLEHARNFEYELTSLIHMVSRDTTPKLAFLVGHDNPEMQPKPDRQFSSISRLMASLRELYDVTSIDLTEKADIPEDVDAIVVLGPKTPFSEQEKQAVDRYISSGGSAAFFLGPVAPDLKTLAANPIDHGLTDLLASYGVKIEPGLVLDTESGGINVSQQRDNMILQKSVPYPFFVLSRAVNRSHPVTRELAGVFLPFAGPLDVVGKKKPGVDIEMLVSSSKKAWIHNEPYDLNPTKQWTLEEAGELAERKLMLAISGQIPSQYSKEKQGKASSAQRARVLISSCHAFLLDDFMSRNSRDLALNLADWLIMEETLLQVRSRGLKPNLLNSDLSDAKRDRIKYLNILGLPLAFVAIGLVRWRLRESRRRKVKL